LLQPFWTANRLAPARLRIAFLAVHKVFRETHPSLHPLSQHHHFALIQALGCGARQKHLRERDSAVQRQADKFIAFWHKTGIVHFREEEEVLLPAYARYTRLDQDAGIMRLLAEHAEIRALWGISSAGARETADEAAAMAHLAKLLHVMCALKRTTCFRDRTRAWRGKSVAMGRGSLAYIPRGRLRH